MTIDSCRYDTFENANIPNMKKIGPLHKAMAPANFTYGSHAAMFVGFTPGIAGVKESFLNPKFGKVFKMIGPTFPAKGTEFITLQGENIIQGFNDLEYTTIGSGAVGWFNPKFITGRVLGKDFQHFFHPGNSHSLKKQLEWLSSKIQEFSDKPLFVFLNIGETHNPYYYDGASWSKDEKICESFSENNDAEKCRMRQKKCLEFIDKKIKDLLDLFSDASIFLC